MIAQSRLAAFTRRGTTRREHERRVSEDRFAWTVSALPPTTSARRTPTPTAAGLQPARAPAARGVEGFLAGGRRARPRRAPRDPRARGEAVTLRARAGRLHPARDGRRAHAARGHARDALRGPAHGHPGVGSGHRTRRPRRPGPARLLLRAEGGLGGLSVALQGPARGEARVSAASASACASSRCGPAEIGGGGLAFVSFEFEPGRGSGEAAGSSCGAPSRRPGDRTSRRVDAAEAFALLEGVTAARFEYFGAENDTASRPGATSGSYPQRLPSHVRLAAQARRGRTSRRWSWRCGIGEEAGCYESSFQRNCVPRR